MGFKMDGLGEKLKNIEPSDFESFKMSGTLIKSGPESPAKRANFKISHEEAKSALSKYEKGLEGVEVSIIVGRGRLPEL